MLLLTSQEALNNSLFHLGVSLALPFLLEYVMKKKYYDVGTFIFQRSLKFGDPVIGGALIGGGSLISGLFGSSAQEDANAANIEIAKAQMAQQEKLFHEGNQFNHDEAVLARDFNSQEAAIARDFNAGQAEINRAFQAGQLEKQMDWYEKYNSASAQVKRYLDAGLNPAALGGKTDYSGSFGTPSGAAATATPATGVSAAAAAAPSVAGAHIEPVNPLGGVLKGALEGLSSYMSARKTGEETKGLVTENQFKEMCIKKGLDLTDSQIAENYAKVESLNAESQLALKRIDEVGATIKNLTASTNKLDVETEIENMRKVYASDSFKFMRDKLEQDYKYSKGLADTIVKYTLSKILANQGAAAASFSQAQYYDSLKSLVPFERQQMENTANFLETQNSREKYNLFLDNQFGWKERYWNVEGKKENVDQQQYHNSTPYRIIQGVKDVAVGAGAAVGTAYGTYKGVKGLSGQKNYIHGN